MSEEYRVKVYLTEFDPTRASELKATLKIYHNSQGKTFFTELLHKVHAGEQQLIYETNNEIDAKRIAHTILRSGGATVIDGLKEKEPEF
ncbi:MAG: hypothetical protein JW797_00865 [Bradymonadales bacterium]|nr:hypothetical protein [Bradymonadales bacterium]